MRSGLRLVVALMLAASASAQTRPSIEARYSRDFARCMATGDAAAGVTSGIMNCNGAEIERQDARLNQAYRMVMMRLNPTRRTVLRAAERDWIRQRDARCQRQAAPEEGGTLANIIYSGCILDETIRRTMWLETYRG